MPTEAVFVRMFVAMKWLEKTITYSIEYSYQNVEPKNNDWFGIQTDIYKFRLRCLQMACSVDTLHNLYRWQDFAIF